MWDNTTSECTINKTRHEHFFCKKNASYDMNASRVKFDF